MRALAPGARFDCAPGRRACQFRRHQTKQSRNHFHAAAKTARKDAERSSETPQPRRKFRRSPNDRTCSSPFPLSRNEDGNRDGPLQGRRAFLQRWSRGVAHLRDLRPRCEPRFFLIAKGSNFRSIFFALISAPAILELCRRTGGILGWPPVDMKAGPPGEPGDY